MNTIFESSTDYLAEAQAAHLSFAKELNTILFEQMERESTVIIDALESAYIVLEEVQQATDQSNNDKRGIFRKIIDFIKKVFTMFTDKVKALVQRDATWLEENEKLFDKINYDGLEISMIQFWKVNAVNLTNSTANANGKILDSSGREIDLFKDMETAKKHPAVSQFLDSEGDLANGIKNYLRTGNAKEVAKPEPLKGDEIKNMIKKEFIPYCKSYDKVVLPAITKEVNSMQQKINILEKTLSRKVSEGDRSHMPAEQPKEEQKPAAPAAAPANNTQQQQPKPQSQPAKNDGPAANPQKRNVVMDSFCLIENTTYGETDLIYCENYNEVVLEAEQAAQTQPANNHQQKTEKPTKVQITDHGSKENSDFHENVGKLNSGDLVAYRNVLSIVQTILTAGMTISEERYTAYMNAMKQIMSARKPPAEQTPANNGSTNNAQVQVKNEEPKKEKRNLFGRKKK